MHRCTLRPSLWPIFGQLQIRRGHVRLLSGVNAAETPSRNEQNLGNQRLGRKKSGQHNAQDKQRERNIQDLKFLDDLLATLEAHRHYNRGPVNHNVQQRVDETILPFKRPSLDTASSENAGKTYEREDEIDNKGQSSTRVRGPSPFEGPVKKASKGESLVKRVQVTTDQACEKEDSVTAEEPQHGHHPQQWPADSVQNVEEGIKTRNTGFVRSVEPLDYTAVVIPITELWEWTGANPSTISTPWASYVEGSTSDTYERSLTVESR